MGSPTLNRIIMAEELQLPWPCTYDNALGTAPRLSLREFHAEYSQVNRGLYLPKACSRPPEERDLGSRINRWGFGYEHHHISRIRARALANPATVFSAWSALRILGLPFWTNDLPVTVASRDAPHSPASCLEAQVIRTPTPDMASRARWQPEFRDLPFATECACLEEATCQALKQVLRGHVRWWLPDPGWLMGHTGFTPEEVRGVQLLDACLRHLGLDLPALRTLARQRIDAIRLRRLAGVASKTADSPAETILRLVLRPVLPDLRAQVDLFQDAAGEGFITTADLFSQRKRIAVFYDGGHHDDPVQRRLDATIDRKLQRLGIRPLRFTVHDLREPRLLAAEVETLAR